MTRPTDPQPPTPNPRPLVPLLVGGLALAGVGIVADYWRMRLVADRAGLPYHDVNHRATLTGPGTGGPLRYLALGDSTAHGIGATDPQHSPPYHIAESLTTHYSPVTFANIAVSGATTADVIRVQLDQVAAFAPDVVTLFIGPNDITHFRTRRDYLADLDHLLTALDVVPAVVVTNVVALRMCPLLSPWFRLVVELQGRRYNAAVPAVVARHRAHLAPINPDLIPAFRGRPDLWAADGYHPNNAGYRIWADYLAPRVQAALRTEV